MQRQSNRDSRQLKLPGIDFAPPRVREHGLRDAHSYPLVSQGKLHSGEHSTSFRVPAADAWDFPEIELRAGHSFPSLILDLDSQAAVQEYYRRTYCESFPECQWMVQRVANGHAHVVYNLAVPVHRGELARERPLREFARIAEYYTSALKADRGYMGVLTHNPMSKAHGPGFKTQWLRRDPYSLGELARVIPFGWKRPLVSCTDIGRNCDLFRALMRWAGCPENMVNDCLAAAHVINQSFDIPLPHAEVAATARSVKKYRFGWITKGRYFTSEQSRLWGRERGIRSGASRRKRTEDRDRAIVQAIEEGESMRSVARRFVLSRMQVWRICQFAK